MSSEWSILTIGDLVRDGEAIVQTGPFGSQLHSHDYVASGTSVIPTEAIGRGRILDVTVPQVDSIKAAELARHRLRLGDILFARRGAQATGLSAIVDKRYEGALCGTGALLLRIKSQRVDPDYLAMFLSSDAAYVWLRTHAVGAVMPNLNTEIIKGLPIALPSIEEQKILASFFGSIDTRINLLRQTIATLEAIAQALFKSWFVDFDPVRAKMESRAPEGMDEATAALFPDGFEESELGLVPRGWRVKPIGDAIEAVGGATPDTKTPAYWEPALHCWTTPKDLSGIAAPVLLDTERKLSDQGLATIGSGALPVGTLLLSSRAPIGYLALAQVPLAINQGYIAMLPGGLLPPLYMLFWCQQNMESIKGRANGSTFMEISKKAFRPIPTLVPSTEVVRAFMDIAGALFDRLVENEKQAQTLAVTRDTLLPRLISGQLRLPEAQTTVAEEAMA
jgi:type I restriction enzyme S subunit